MTKTRAIRDLTDAEYYYLDDLGDDYCNLEMRRASSIRDNDMAAIEKVNDEMYRIEDEIDRFCDKNGIDAGQVQDEFLGKASLI